MSRSFSASKSFDVAVEAQTDFVKTSYEKAVGQATRFGELYLDMVKDVAKPFDGFRSDQREVSF